jgi:hypothetical protein
MTPDGPAHVRATSTLTVTARVCHDGSPLALAQHLAAETGPLLGCWGVEVLALDVTADPINEGDPTSGRLPAIGCPHPHDDMENP